MPLVLADRVRETTTTTGTGTISLAGPVSGFQGFSTAIGNANTTYYTIVDAATGAWEVGLGTYTSSGSTLARTTVLSSSNSDALVPFGAGTKDVFVTQPAERAVYVLGAGTGLAAGAAAFTANGVPYASATNTLATSSNFIFDGTSATITGDFSVASTYALYADNIRTYGSGNLAFSTNNPGAQLITFSTGPGVGTQQMSVGASTVTFTNNPTLSAGTANGVAYLNASKVLTTGSALTFDGTNMSIGGTLDGGKLTLIGTAGFAGTGLSIFENSTGNNARLRLQQDSGVVVYNATYSTGGNAHAWQIGSSEQMRLTSTGLGIGTSSPAAKLDVNGTAAISGAVTLSGGTANGVLYLNGSKVATSGSALTFDGTTLALNANQTFDNARVLQWKNTSGVTRPVLQIFSDNNLYIDSEDGSQIFRTGGSEQMRLTSTGLGIGTNSPAYKLDVVGTAAISGGVTFSGGTANGVAYLNGSKVLTTGSALTFDGTNLSNTGRFIVNNAGSAAGTTDISLGSYSGGAWLNTPSATIGYLAVAGGSAFRWDASNLVGYIGGSEGMRLTSTGLGIGTSSPSRKLTVFGSDGVPFFNVNGYDVASWTGATLDFGGMTAAQWNTLRFFTSGSERMRLDSSGNLGIGTSSPAAKLQVSGGNIRLDNNQGLEWGGGNNFIYGNEATDFVAIATNGSERARIDSSGNLGIGTSSPTFGAGSGLEIERAGVATLRLENSTAGNNFELYSDSLANGINLRGYNNAPMVFWTNNTERMRLDASGNLGLGVTPSAWRSGALSYDVARSSYADDNGTLTIASNAYRATSNWLYKVSTFATRMDSDSGQFRWYTAPSGTAGNAITFTQAMTLDDVGRLNIGGTASPGAYRLAITGDSASYMGGIIFRQSSTDTLYLGSIAANNTTDFEMWNPRNGYIRFATNNTERARITSGGDLLVGTTNASASAGSGLKVLPESNGVNGPQIAIVTAASANTTASLSLYSTGAGAYRFYVADGGTIYATSTSITGISDQRLKENIQDIDVGLDAIMALKPRKFDWKAGKGKDKKGDRGWIAQEFEQVFPDMVDTWADPAPEGEEPYKAVNADLIPVLVKAIQELKAEFDAYKATHP